MMPDALGSGRSVTVRWLGTAGFSIHYQGWTLLIDPYLTRAPLWRCLGSRVQPDLATIHQHISGADAIVCGHTHFDHVLDVPAIAHMTGARVFGSSSAVRLCRAAGLAEHRLVDVERGAASGEQRADVGPFALRFVPSAHSPLLAGRVPFPGEIRDCDEVPSRIAGYRCGAVFGVAVTVADRTLYHLGSANLRDGPAAGLPPVDLLLLCVAGWTSTPRFVSRLLRSVSPGAIVLSHWDDFFRSLERGARALPAIGLPRLVDALSRQAPGTRVGTLPLLGEVRL